MSFDCRSVYIVTPHFLLLNIAPALQSWDSPRALISPPAEILHHWYFCFYSKITCSQIEHLISRSAWFKDVSLPSYPGVTNSNGQTLRRWHPGHRWDFNEWHGGQHPPHTFLLAYIIMPRFLLFQELLKHLIEFQWVQTCCLRWGFRELFSALAWIRFLFLPALSDPRNHVDKEWRKSWIVTAAYTAVTQTLKCRKQIFPEIYLWHLLSKPLPVSEKQLSGPKHLFYCAQILQVKLQTGSNSCSRARASSREWHPQRGFVPRSFTWQFGLQIHNDGSGNLFNLAGVT